jgi:NAD(P)-dependent dehydrogenase (short-subunit alcohol dehydrogenase family)
LDAAVAATAATLGGIDVVVANAGIANLGTVRTVDPATFAKTIDINLTGVYRTIWPAVPHLVDSRGYALVVASLASLVPLPGGASYSASKAGAEYLAAALRTELAQYGVAVGSVHPSWIDTDLVRDSESLSPTFAKMRKDLPWPANTTNTVEACADAMVAAIERRARKVHVPNNTKLLANLRPLVLGGWFQRLVEKQVRDDLRQLDEENRARGVTWH